jgi:hypothetical protein
MPTLLSNAFDLAAENGLTLPALADELAWPSPRSCKVIGLKRVPVPGAGDRWAAGCSTRIVVDLLAAFAGVGVNGAT